MNRLVATAVFLLLLPAGWAAAVDGKAARLNRQANDLYKEGKNEEALKRYAEALARDPGSRPLTYNMGNALFRLGRLDEALSAYGAVAEGARPDTELGQAARFNEGTASLQAKDYAAAVKSLRQAVMANPSDDDARHNLELALSRLQQQQEQEQQQQKKDGDQGKEKSGADQQSQDADAQDRQEDNKQKGEPQDQQQQQQQKQSEPEGEPPPQSRGEKEEGTTASAADSQPEMSEQQDLSEEEARRLLASLARDERQDLKESLEKPPPRGKRGGRDW